MKNARKKNCEKLSKYSRHHHDLAYARKLFPTKKRLNCKKQSKNNVNFQSI